VHHVEDTITAPSNINQLLPTPNVQILGCACVPHPQDNSNFELHLANHIFRAIFYDTS